MMYLPDKHGHDENRMRTETLLVVTIAADGRRLPTIAYLGCPGSGCTNGLWSAPARLNRAASPLVPSFLTGSPLPEAARAIAGKRTTGAAGELLFDRLGRSGACFCSAGELDLVGEAYSHRRNWDRRGD
jgi:hypothetical protein